MPYTPPSPSPNASHTQSRTSSRSSSFSEISSPPSASILISPSKPQPTRSTSYLNKHRRSSLGGPRPDVKTQQLMMSPPGGSGPVLHPPRSTSGSIRQVPQVPIMSTGVVISPPDSSQNSSDDEAGNSLIKRGRQLVDVKELEAAIRNSIPQRRAASPVMDPKPEQIFIEQRSPEILSARIHEKLAHVVGHSRSASDGSGSRQAPIRQPEQPKGSQSQGGSPNMDDDDDYPIVAPPMVRKKSGELVKSSLKSPNLKRRPSSMPSTPTYPKVVHFDSHLEHVRHFLHSERPTAVSAGSSPVESGMDTDNEYPFPSEEPPFEWEIATPNFPDRRDRSTAVVRVEKVLLSHDKKSLLGHVAVANIAFQKLVVARFTLDYWQTTSEVAAEFTNDIRRRHQEDGYDRFTFKIKLEDMANLENKTLFFCVRYRCQDKEFWDNNNSINYQVDFKKKPVPQHGKSGPSSASSRPLPRSRGTNAAAPRPRSMPIFDDSFDAYDLKTQPEYKMFSHVVDQQMDMRPTKPAKKTSAVDPEALARRANPSGNAFGNRYDFGASLAAAMATATNVLGPERSGLKLKTNLKEEKPVPNPYFHNLTASSGLPRSHSSPALSATFTTVNDKHIPRVTLDASTPADTPATTPTTFKPSLDALKSLGSDRKPSVESASYKEILENFCFFGSAKSSPSLATGHSMPNRPEGPGHENHTLAASNYKMSSRSPSPPHQGMDGVSGHGFITSPSTSSSSQGSQKGSRSPSPSNIYGFPATTPFDIRAPIIQT